MKRASNKTEPGLMLYFYISAVSAIFNVARVVEPRFRRATRFFEATYQFRSGASAVRLIFSGGAIKTRFGACASPDCEIEFIDLGGALNHILKKPNDTLTLLLENKVVQDGNAYYFLKLGYLNGLIERIIHITKSRITELQ